MVNMIKVEVPLRHETIKRMDEIIVYSKFRKRYTKQDLPESYEDVIKAALYDYFRKIDVLYNNVISDKKYKLKNNGNLQNRLKEMIKDEGMKQKDICDMTGIDPGSLSNILSNRNQPSMDYFLRIWVVLGCPPIEDVFYRDGEN